MWYKGLTKRVACEQWVAESNAFSLWMVEKLAGEGLEGISKLTPIVEDDYVTYFKDWGTYTVKSVDREEGTLVLISDDEEEVVADLNEVEKVDDDYFPMWNTLWEFPNIDEDDAELVAKCGFEMYELTEDGTILIGINGCGYSFYEAHWLPLYDAKGMCWHDTETE